MCIYRFPTTQLSFERLQWVGHHKRCPDQVNEHSGINTERALLKQKFSPRLFCRLFGTLSKGGPTWHVSVVMGNKLNYGMLPQPQANQRVREGTLGNSGLHFQLWLVGSAGSRFFIKHFNWPHWNIFPNNFQSENMDISSFEMVVMRYSMFSTWHQYI